jgi:pimeloyl-ACP methyl ester carboxylesterase
MIDGKYRTLGRRGSRGIAGQSMGGYGALRIAMHRPEKFGAVLSMSPVNLFNPDPFGAPAQEAALSAADSPIEDGPLLARLMWSKAAAFSPDADSPPWYARLPFRRTTAGIIRDDAVWENWLDNCLTQRLPRYAARLGRVRIRLQVGDQDPAMSEVRVFADALRQHDVPFSLDIFEGGHVSGVRRQFETSVFSFFDRHFVGEAHRARDTAVSE